MFTKTCKRCSKTKPIEQFYKNKETVDGRHSHCAECSKAIARDRRIQNPIAAKESQRRAHLKSTFGITFEEYEALFTGQKGVCAICGKPPDYKRLAVDHDHTTDRVRGLLCQQCNTGIGLLGDSSELLEKALAYLNQQ